MLLAGTPGGSDTGPQALPRGLDLVLGDQDLRGHLIAGGIVRVPLFQLIELRHRQGGLSVLAVFHGKAVASEGGVGVLPQYLCECRYFIRTHVFSLALRVPKGHFSTLRREGAHLKRRMRMRGRKVWRRKIKIPFALMAFRAAPMGEAQTCKGKTGKARMKDTSFSQTGSSVQPRTVAESQSEMTELVLPNDTNTLGNLLGGRLMHFIDLVGAMAAYRHSRAHVVTASMEHIDFIAPVHVGDLVILKASVNRAFQTSMEIGVKAWVENAMAGTLRHVSSAYLTFVAVDENGRRLPVPPLLAESAEERRRFEDAGRRRKQREEEHERKRQNRAQRDSEAAAAMSSREG